MKETDFHSHLKEMVLSSCGIKIAEIGHSGEISRKIFARDRNYISETNIRRFFFLLKEPYKPSPFVLNSLSVFVGFASWEEFITKTARECSRRKRDSSSPKTACQEPTKEMETFVYTFGKFNRYHS